MCSNEQPGGSPGSPAHPTALLDRLEQVLQQLSETDVSGLTSEQHTSVLPRLVQAQSVLHGVVLDEVASFDATDVASLSRHRTTKRWLEHRTRLSAGAASHLVSTAWALRDHLPATRDALRRGQVSPAHVGAISAVVRTVGVEHAVAAEPILLRLARHAEPTVVRRAAARIHALVDPVGAERALHDAYEKRGVTLSIVGQRGYLDGVLDVESAELLQSALQPLMTSGSGDRRSVPQLRADALLDLAKKALDHGAVPQLGGERPHLSVVIDQTDLRGRGGSVLLPWTGAHVPAASARRWACDAQISPVLARLLPAPPNGGRTDGEPTVSLGGGWLPLQVGRASRTATTSQLRALRVRDGGCVHPGCSRTAAYCDAHHVVHWADGGSTDLSNMVLLCRHHHRTLHAGLWSVGPDPEQPGVFVAGVDGWQVPAQSMSDRSPPVLVR